MPRHIKIRRIISPHKASLIYQTSLAYDKKVTHLKNTLLQENPSWSEDKALWLARYKARQEDIQNAILLTEHSRKEQAQQARDKALSLVKKILKAGASAAVDATLGATASATADAILKRPSWEFPLEDFESEFIPPPPKKEKE